MPVRKSITKKDVIYLRTVTFPDLEQGKIHKYGKYRSKTDPKRYYLKCLEELYDDNGVLCICDMRFERDDNFKKWLLDHEHECRPGFPKDQRTLDEYQDTGDKDDMKMTEDHLHREMAIFTGEMNLPLDLLTSDSFYNLAIDFISFGLFNARVKNYRDKALELFHQIKRDKLRHLMTTEALQRHKKILTKFSKLSYVCVAMDEGTTAHYQNLHFVLENPLSIIKSYPYTIVNMKGSDTTSYLDAIPKGLFPLKVFKIKIGSVVIDGQTAQKKAWNPNYKDSILFNRDIENSQNIIVIPCLCHRVHNAYKRVAKSNKELKELIEILHSLSKTCRAKESSIGAVCPQHIDTRWANDYDIVNFIIQKRKKILAFEKETPINQFIQLEKVLKVFKCLILQFENPKTKFSTAFITLERAINCLYQLEHEYKVPFGEELSQSLSKYTLEAKDGGIWGLGYSFTPEGRKDFIERLSDQENPTEESYLEYFDIDDYPEYIDEDQSPLIDLRPEEEVLMTEEGDPVESDDDMEPTADDGDEGQAVSDDSNEEEEEDESILTDGNAKLNETKHVTAAKRALQEILETRNYRNKSQAKIHMRVYNSYLEPGDDKYDTYINTTMQYSWIQIRNEEDNMEQIGDIAMRLLSAALSEASCERAISNRRNIHTSKRMRSRPDLLNARNILQSSK